MGEESSPSIENKEKKVDEKKTEEPMHTDEGAADQEIESKSDMETQENVVESETDEILDEGGEVKETEGEEEPEKEKEETLEEMKERYENELKDKDDKYLRLVAEFENFKKRTTQEIQTRFKYANQAFALSIISGLDNLERALTQAQEEESEQLKEFVRGIDMVQQQFYDALKQYNIERINPRGEPFDPNLHEAVGVIETEEVEPDHISEVFQAGYVLHDRVIRPAMVQVAKKK